MTTSNSRTGIFGFEQLLSGGPKGSGVQIGIGELNEMLRGGLPRSRPETNARY